ncbi:MAG: ABC transporter ATP-binding protein, partial [Cystobacter sp.]
EESRAPKVSVRGVSVTFPGEGEPFQALAPVDLDCRAGEFLCLLGPSGCGKSTLLHVLGGFLKPTTGQVLIDGAPVTRPDPRRIFVFQERGVFPWLSVEDNIGFGLKGLPLAERRDRIARVMALVGLTGFARAYPSELSGGMKQRLEVARALAVKPDVLFMDEPFSALDAITRHTLRHELSRIWATERQTILFVTHDIDEAVQLADRVLIMSSKPGRIQRVVEIDLPRPRELTSPRYLEYRNHLLDELGLAHQV